MTAMAACHLVRRKISSPACRSQVLPLIHRCIYFKEQNLPFVRQFSSVKEENKAASQDLKLSDNCIKVGLCNISSILQLFLIKGNGDSSFDFVLL